MRLGIMDSASFRVPPDLQGHRTLRNSGGEEGNVSGWFTEYDRRTETSNIIVE
jgi:hypothetical protein